MTWSARFTVALAILTVASAACSRQVQFEGPGEPCTSDSTCASGFFCVDSVCLTGTSTPCTSDTDCGAAEVCDVTDGFCVEAIVGHAGGHGRSGGAGIRGAGGAGGNGGAGTGGA